MEPTSALDEGIEMEKTSSLGTKLEYYRAKLLPYAYNIIGQVEPSRDVIEELIIPFFMSSNPDVKNESGYLIRSVINKSISYKSKLQNQQEHYPGQWLPEPIVTADAVYDQMDKQRILKYSLLVLLEKLNAEERAVFILKNAFEYRHAEIASILEVTEVYSRQLFKRAKDKIHHKKGARKPLDQTDTELLDHLLDAMSRADLEQIQSLLAEDVLATSDGGPKVSAARNILPGKGRVSKLLKAIGTKYMPDNVEVELSILNHQPSILYRIGQAVYRAIILDTSSDGIGHAYIIVNPDKLNHLKK